MGALPLAACFGESNGGNNGADVVVVRPAVEYPIQIARLGQYPERSRREAWLTGSENPDHDVLPDDEKQEPDTGSDDWSQRQHAAILNVPRLK